jgi:hypothetical protein
MRRRNSGSKFRLPRPNPSAAMFLPWHGVRRRAVQKLARRFKRAAMTESAARETGRSG